MDLTPMRGVCFVRPIETAETLPNGRILLPEAYRQRLTAQQAEVVAVGPPGLCDEPEDCERPHCGIAGTLVTRDVAVRGLRAKGYRPTHPVDPRVVPGAWVLCAKWAYVGVREKLFAVRHEDIIGVFVE